MKNEEICSAYKLSDKVMIKRWRVTGTVVARAFSPLCYDIQCGKKLHRKVPAKWVSAVAGEANNVIRLAA
jgi:hypothetical protein